MSTLESTHFVRHAKLIRERVPSMDVYPYAIPAVRAVESIEFHPNVTFLVGENGSGKSTLIEGLAVAMRVSGEGGSRSLRVETHNTLSPLGEALRVVRTHNTPRDFFFLRAESFYNVATQLDRMGGAAHVPYGGRSLHQQSHGESFLALVHNRFGPRGFYLLDEPEAALSPTRQLRLLVMIDELVNEGAQLIIATHSPILMAYPRATIYVLDDSGAHATRWEDTEAVAITRMFLANPAARLAQLLAADPPDDEPDDERDA